MYQNHLERSPKIIFSIHGGVREQESKKDKKTRINNKLILNTFILNLFCSQV